MKQRGWMGPTMSARGLAFAMVLGFAPLGCAGDSSSGESEGSTGVDSAGPQTGAPASDGSADTAADTTAPEVPCDDGGCEQAPTDCFEPGGTCIDGLCDYTPRLAGEPCDDDCEAGGYCDAMGTCICRASSSECDDTCADGSNFTATCEAGECLRVCTAPYDNCDGDWANGCEVPVGVPGVCDASGLNLETGCWTAYCGQSDAIDTYNFEGYYCADCPTCSAPAVGQCR